MSQQHPGNELSIEQLVHALARALDPNSLSRRTFLELEPQKIFGIERDLRDALQTVKAIRNTYTPVNKFPPEVLSRVFDHRNCGQDLIAATHVCQYWRSTLISTPSLWTSIHFRLTNDVDRTLTYLERSKAALIDIDISVSERFTGDLNAIQHFSPHISRTRSLTVTCHCDIKIISFLLLCKPVMPTERPSPSSEEVLVGSLDNFIGQQAPSLPSPTSVDICPALESPFPLHSLNNLDLTLLWATGPLRISRLFGLCSNCPQLQRFRLSIDCKILEDVTLGQIVSMDSLVELEYSCETVARFISFLNLPRLNRLRVTLRRGKVDKLAHLLPHSGRNFLSGATSMSHLYDRSSQTVELSGKGVEASFKFFDGSSGPTYAEWLSDEAYIPFGQIEDLKLRGFHMSGDFPIHPFKNLKTFRVNPWDQLIAGKVLRLLRPLLGAGTPCPSLRDIDYTFLKFTYSLMKSFVNVARERERAGHKLMLVKVLSNAEFDPSLEEELREHVGTLRVDIYGKRDYD